MPRIAKRITCTEEQRNQLVKLSNSRTERHQLVVRASIVLECINGTPIKNINSKYSETPSTIRKWRDRFEKSGLEGLNDLPRSGAPKTYGDEFRKRVFEMLSTEPPNGLSHWDGETLAQSLNASHDAVWRLLRKERICLSRQRTWCVSTDPEFTQKAADIVGLYLDTPTKAIVISVDEKPSIQALSRTTGYVVTKNRKVVRGMKSTYKRNGTLNLFAALEIATGHIHSKSTQTKKRVDFLSFMDDLLSELTATEDSEIHVILDNYCIHKRCTEWLEAHPQVRFHFTPTSASWLNQVEIWFGIFSRKVLNGASFDSTDKLANAIESYVQAYNENAKPFIWRKRDVVGSQLKNTINNLRN